MAKDGLNKTKQDLKYHSLQAYNLGNYYQQEIKTHPVGLYFINFSKTVSYEVNLTSQPSHLEALLLSTLWTARGIFFC